MSKNIPMRSQSSSAVRRVDSPIHRGDATAVMSSWRSSVLIAAVLGSILSDDFGGPTIDGIFWQGLCSGESLLSSLALLVDLVSIISDWGKFRLMGSTLDKDSAINLSFRLVRIICELFQSLPFYNVQQALRTWAHQVVREYVRACSKISSLAWLMLD